MFWCIFDVNLNTAVFSLRGEAGPRRASIEMASSDATEGLQEPEFQPEDAQVLAATSSDLFAPVLAEGIHVSTL